MTPARVNLFRVLRDSTVSSSPAGGGGGQTTRAAHVRHRGHRPSANARYALTSPPCAMQRAPGGPEQKGRPCRAATKKETRKRVAAASPKAGPQLAQSAAMEGRDDGSARKRSRAEAEKASPPVRLRLEVGETARGVGHSMLLGGSAAGPPPAGPSGRECTVARPGCSQWVSPAGSAARGSGLGRARPPLAVALQLRL